MIESKCETQKCERVRGRVEKRVRKGWKILRTCDFRRERERKRVGNDGLEK